MFLGERLVSRASMVAIALVVALVIPAGSRAATLAPTPYMGWNTYYGLGGSFNEAAIKSVASSLVSSGLAQAGYRIVWLDAGWTAGARDSTGQLTVDSAQWPDGMTGLTSWLHQQGLQAGIYTDAGTSGCGGRGVGSYGRYQQDANTFAAWGFDAVKVDFCGAGQAIAAGQLSATPQGLYAQFAAALANNSSQRPMLLNVDNFWTPGQIDGTNPSVANSSWDNFQWAPQIAQSWRTDTDIGFIGNVQFQWVLRNLDQDAANPQAAGPGHWNDPDYLGPELGMTGTEAQSQFSMWAMLAAPLILGSDPRKLSAATIGMLENAHVIAVDQDPAGAQATVVQQSGSEQTWSKPLANGDRAVALLNRGSSTLQISTTAGTAGLPPAGGYTVEDLWANTTVGTNSAGNITASVPPHGVALYRVSANPGGPPPGTALLTVHTAGPGSGMVSDNTGSLSCLGSCAAAYSDGSVVTLTANPSPGSAFAGWSGGGCSGTRTCTVTISANTDVTATFAPARTLAVSVLGDGTVTDNTGALSCSTTCLTPYPLGAQPVLTASPRPGSAFAGWSGAGCYGTGACILTLSSDAAVTARFVPARTVTVSVIGAGSGTVTAPGISCPGTCSASYPVGSWVTLTATPAQDSQFGAWLTDGCRAAQANCTLPPPHDAQVTVAFDRPRTGVAYVVNTKHNEVTPIDLATDTAERAITGLDAPRGIVTAPDGGTAYVVNSGNNTVTPINLATDATEPPITGLDRPGPMAIAPGGRTAYVLEDNRSLVPIDLVTDQREPATTLAAGSGVGNRAASIAITPSGRTAYVGTFTTTRTGAARGTVAAVDLANGRVTGVIRGFARPAAIAITRNGKTAYVVDSVRGRVTAISLATNRRIKAPGLTSFRRAGAVAITPGGNAAYVASTAGVGQIDATTKSAAWVAIKNAADLAITPNGATAYVTTRDSVVPIDLATNTARAAITGFGSPGAIAITVPPPPDFSAELRAPPKWSGTALTDSVTCTSASMRCTTIEALTSTQAVLGSVTTAIPPGHTVKVRIRLTVAGRRLLIRLGGLHAVLTLALRRGAHVDTLTARSLALRP